MIVRIRACASGYVATSRVYSFTISVLSISGVVAGGTEAGAVCSAGALGAAGAAGAEGAAGAAGALGAAGAEGAAGAAGAAGALAIVAGSLWCSISAFGAAGAVPTDFFAAMISSASAILLRLFSIDMLMDS